MKGAAAPRRCYNCGRDLAIEPAIKEPLGLLCFTCRYRIDQPVWDRYILERQLYEKQRAEWQDLYGAQWHALEARVRKGESLVGGVLGLVFVCAFLFAALVVQSGGASLFLVVVFFGVYLLRWSMVDAADVLISSNAERVLSASAKRNGYPPPPAWPEQREWSIRSRPALLFDGNRKADLNPEFRDFKPGYPPDWEERRAECLRRDSYRCRICGETREARRGSLTPTMLSQSLARVNTAFKT